MVVISGGGICVVIAWHFSFENGSAHADLANFLCCSVGDDDHDDEDDV